MKGKGIIIALLLLVTLPLAGQNSSKQKKQLEKLRGEIAELDRQIKANDSKSADAAARLELTRMKVETGKQLVAQAGKSLDSLEVELERKQREIDLASGQLDTTMQLYGKLVQRAYLSRDTNIWFVYIFSGEGLGQTIRRAAYMKSISHSLKAQAKSIRDKKASLQEQKASLDSLKADYKLILEQRSADLDALKADEKAEKDIVDALKKDKEAYRKKLAKMQKEADALNRKIQEMVAAEAKAKAKAKSKSKAKSKEDVKQSSGFAANKGKLPWPVSGTVVGRYGQHYHPVYKNVALPFNNGINIATSAGAEVKAVFNGEVRQVVVMPGYNQCILVQHGEYYTFYCKLKDVTVKAGDKVKTGTVLGHVDTISGETQLHFQVWKGTDSTDPEKWLR